MDTYHQIDGHFREINMNTYYPNTVDALRGKELLLVDYLYTIVSNKSELRPGTIDFFKYWTSNGNEIIVHSDGVFKDFYDKMAERLGFADYVKRYFGHPNQRNFTHEGHDYFVKDFNSMLSSVDIKKNKTLIISDEDYEAALVSDIDLLKVPKFYQGKGIIDNFSFKNLI